MALVWYILRSKPNKEEFFWGQLVAHQIEVYYPYIRARAFSTRARKNKPFFPNHLFIRVDLQENPATFLDWLPGSDGLVVFNGKPAKIPEGMIAAIRCQVDQINFVDSKGMPGYQPERADVVQDGIAPKYATIFEGCQKGSERLHALLACLRNNQLLVEIPDVAQP
jgi:hypothetical protein